LWDTENDYKKRTWMKQGFVYNTDIRPWGVQHLKMVTSVVKTSLLRAV